jgi:pimeloyl-ACP methyl ester carboxylesterase
MQIVRDGVALGYDDAGSGDLTLLLVHGWGTDRTLLRPLFDHAQRAHRVLSVDLRGFGESDAPVQPYTIAGYTDDLAFLIDRLGVERPLVVGHSMGGIVALDFAARHPSQIAGAILLEAMVVAPDAVFAGLRPMLQAVRGDGYRDFARGLMNHLTGPHFDPAEGARLAALVASCPQHVLVSALEGIIAFDSVASAAAVTCPLLFMGTSTTYIDVDRFRALCPQLVTGQLVGCGHYFPLEVPEQVNAMVDRFIQTALPPRRRSGAPAPGGDDASAI